MQRVRGVGGLTAVRLALVASVAVHVGVLAWATGAVRPPLAIAPKPIEPEPEPVPIDVVLLDQHAPVAGATRDGGLPSHATAHGGGTRVTTSSRTGTETAPVGPSEHPSHSRYMTMRGPELELPSSFDPGPVPSAPPPPERSRHSQELQPDGGGHYKSEHETFTAHVNPDGTAHFDNRPDVDLHPGCLIVGCNMSFDDALMRRAGIDPYASAKRQWLEKTFEERAAIGLAHRRDELARSAEYMQKNLAWMWQKTRDPIERKQAVFELWDEVAEIGDDDLVHGGQAARNYLIGFVRSHLPDGSPDAFTQDELAQLNAHRRSRTAFAPY